jgi:hypothetical protein
MKEIVVGDAPKKTVNAEPKPRSYKPSFLANVFSVVSEDIRTFIFNRRVVIEETPDGWEDYKRFVELAKGKK